MTNRIWELVPTWRWGALTVFGAAIHTHGGMFAFAFAFGMFSSAVNGLFSTALAVLTSDMSQMGICIGITFRTTTSTTPTWTPTAEAILGSI